MVILSAKTHQETWYTRTNLPGNYLIAISETGYSNDILSLEWIKHFDNYSAKKCLGA